MSEKAKIIILRTLKHGESDLIVHGLTSTGGRLHLIAKGGQKSKRRFAGGILDPMHYLQVVFKRKAGEDVLHFLEEAQLLEDFHKIRTDYERLEVGFYFLKLAAKIAQEDDQHSKELFDLLGNSLKVLQSAQNLRLLRTHFEIKLLAQQGVLEFDQYETEPFRIPLEQSDHIKIEDVHLKAIRQSIHLQMQEYLNHNF